MWNAFTLTGPSATEKALKEDPIQFKNVLTSSDLSTQYRSNNILLLEYLQRPKTQHELINLIRSSNDRELLKCVVNLFQSSNVYLCTLFANNLILLNECVEALNDDANGGYGAGLISRFLLRTFDYMYDDIAEALRLGDDSYITIIKHVDRSVVFQSITDLINPVHSGIHLFCWYLFMTLLQDLSEDDQNDIHNQFFTIKTIGEKDLYEDLKKIDLTEAHKFNIAELLKYYFKIPKNDWNDEDAKLHLDEFEKAFTIFLIRIPNDKIHPKYFEVISEFGYINLDLVIKVSKLIENEMDNNDDIMSIRFADTALKYMAHVIKISNQDIETIILDSIRAIKYVLFNPNSTFFALQGCKSIVKYLILRKSIIAKEILPKILIRANKYLNDKSCNEIKLKRPFIYWMAYRLKGAHLFKSSVEQLEKWKKGDISLVSQENNLDIIPNTFDGIDKDDFECELHENGDCQNDSDDSDGNVPEPPFIPEDCKYE